MVFAVAGLGMESLWGGVLIVGWQYIHAMRLYQAMPEWASLKRGEETEANSFRKAYVEARSKGFAAQEK